MAVCYVLASLAARPAGRMVFQREEADSLATDTLSDSVAAGILPMRAYTIMPDSVPEDTVPADTTPQSKNALDLPVNYSAEDSITFDYQNSRAHLYGDGKVSYQNLELEAELIQIAIDSSLVHATSRTDSTGTGFLLTVTVQVATFFPALADTVAVPSETPVTSPLSETVATLLLELDQVTVLSVTSLGDTEAFSWTVCPTKISAALCPREISVTSIGAGSHPEMIARMLRIAVIVMAVLNSLLFISFMSLSLQIDAFGFAFKFSYAIRECLSGRFPGTE